MEEGDDVAASLRRQAARLRRQAMGESMRARWTPYMLDGAGRPRRLLWMDMYDILSPYMSPESPDDALRAARARRPDGRGYEVVVEYDQVLGEWLVNMEGWRRVIPEDVIVETDLDRARAVWERRGWHLMRTDPAISEPGVGALLDITPRQLGLLSHDPLCRQLARWGRPHGEMADWANPHPRRPLVMVVHPDDSYALGVRNEDRPFPLDMFWERAAAEADDGAI